MRSAGKDGDGLVATLYGPCHVSTKISGTSVEIKEQTSYPFSHTIEFAITTGRPVKFPLRFRWPSWSGEPVLDAAGAKVTRDERGFLVANKKWKSGDLVRLTLRPSVQGRTAVNGTTAVTYGPLVFSLPVPEKAEITQRFPAAEAAGLKDFYGYQYDPVDLVSAKRPLSLQTGKPAFGLSVVEDKGGDSLYPWEHPPLKLRGEMVSENGRSESLTLLPMGSTLLRRTCFPAAP
jgi:DUF1680 family protein